VSTAGDTTVRSVTTAAYRVPTLAPESDGTATWDATEVVVVHITAGDQVGVGWSYCPAAPAALIIDTLLAPLVDGRDALDVAGAWTAMITAVRNAGRPGLISMAISAVDLALWDLKAKLHDVALHTLLGQVRDTVPVYGSGGFTSQDDTTLIDQLHAWIDTQGITQVKIKVGEDWGRHPERDLARTTLTRRTVGEPVDVFVDANGAYTPGQARRLGRAYDDLGVTWVEEPVSSDSLSDLAALRRALRCDIAAGEYGHGARYTQQMLTAEAVDCLQIDITRCAGLTEWMRCAAIAASAGLDVSAHCAPALHVAPAMCVPNLRHIEYFADHARLEPLLFTGVLTPQAGVLRPSDLPGNGLALRPAAVTYRI